MLDVYEIQVRIKSLLLKEYPENVVGLSTIKQTIEQNLSDFTRTGGYSMGVYPNGPFKSSSESVEYFQILRSQLKVILEYAQSTAIARSRVPDIITDPSVKEQLDLVVRNARKDAIQALPDLKGMVLINEKYEKIVKTVAQMVYMIVVMKNIRSQHWYSRPEEKYGFDDDDSEDEEERDDRRALQATGQLLINQSPEQQEVIIRSVFQYEVANIQPLTHSNISEFVDTNNPPESVVKQMINDQRIVENEGSVTFSELREQFESVGLNIGVNVNIDEPTTETFLQYRVNANNPMVPNTKAYNINKFESILNQSNILLKSILQDGDITEKRVALSSFVRDISKSKPKDLNVVELSIVDNFVGAHLSVFILLTCLDYTFNSTGSDSRIWDPYLRPYYVSLLSGMQSSIESGNLYVFKEGYEGFNIERFADLWINRKALTSYPTASGKINSAEPASFTGFSNNLLHSMEDVCKGLTRKGNTYKIEPYIEGQTKRVYDKFNGLLEQYSAIFPDHAETEMLRHYLKICDKMLNAFQTGGYVLPYMIFFYNPPYNKTTTKTLPPKPEQQQQSKIPVR